MSDRSTDLRVKFCYESGFAVMLPEAPYRRHRRFKQTLGFHFNRMFYALRVAESTKETWHEVTLVKSTIGTVFHQ
ncbi:MAG TPA: hypothetical protein VEW46_15115 [Pyrinomonadaceae bacterium]|nr:hypothetical protein [Pyrinomonadaceae bacterium]